MDKEQCGKLIHFLRKENGLSQKEFAEAMHVTPSCVCKWEQGTSLPDTCMIEALANFFAISCDDFYHPEDALHHLSNPGKENAQQSATSEPEQNSISIKTHRFRKLYILFPLIILPVIITAIILVLNINKTPFTELSAQYAEHETLGPIYHVEYSVSQEQKEYIIHEHAKNVVTSLVTNSYINNGIDAIMVSYYFEYDDNGSDYLGYLYCQIINSHKELAYEKDDLHLYIINEFSPQPRKMLRSRRNFLCMQWLYRR